MTRLAAPAEQWTSANHGAALTGLTTYRFMKYAMMGEIKTLVRPGFPVMYRRADVERLRAKLAAESK